MGDENAGRVDPTAGRGGQGEQRRATEPRHQPASREAPGHVFDHRAQSTRTTWTRVAVPSAVFLAGGKGGCFASRRTYTKRLWCVVEVAASTSPSNAPCQFARVHRAASRRSKRLPSDWRCHGQHHRRAHRRRRAQRLRASSNRSVSSGASTEADAALMRTRTATSSLAVIEASFGDFSRSISLRDVFKGEPRDSLGDPSVSPRGRRRPSRGVPLQPPRIWGSASTWAYYGGHRRAHRVCRVRESV